MVKNALKKSISIILIILILTSLFTSCQNQELKGLEKLLSYTLEDSAIIIEKYPAILCGEEDSLKKNLSDLYPEHDYESTLGYFKSLYYLALVKENQFDALTQEMKTRLSVDAAKEDLRNLWIVYIQNSTFFTQDITLKMIDTLKQVATSKDNSDLMVYVLCFEYFFDQYFNLTEKAKDAKDALLSMQGSEKLSESPQLILENQKFDYSIALLFEDQYDKFESFFVNVYSSSIFCSIEIDLLLSRNMATNNKDQRIKRLESLLCAVETLYKQEKQHANENVVQMKLIKESIVAIKKTLESSKN